ncbi:hypothetical protein CYG48_05560 [Neorhizobium sp. SOG26]|uniref:hypothetical protein n=1 Tax=Neorhizobium sp. SOG26 TaxID=2060726 RepID=UPI000E595A67|nr:hypothetical protein [Neorhizobium sp. SOG26]AXV15216.1 hypothetical protein CYG48_05560 [Neorhizobium sp. SOG26]
MDALRREGEVVPEAAPQQNEPELSEADAVLVWHGGDSRAAIETLLEDCRHLRQELALTEGASSRGFTRGWRPSYERD